MADTRIFKVTEGGYKWSKVRYVTRRALAGILSESGISSRRRLVTKIEATDQCAVTGWADVTEEFLPDGTGT